MWMIFEGCHRLYNIHIFEALFLHVVAGDWFWIFPPHEQNALPWIIPVQMSRCLKSAYSYHIIEQRDNVPLSLCSMERAHSDRRLRSTLVRTARGPKTGRRKKRKVTAPFRTGERAGGRAAIEALPKIWACIRETKTHLCGEERKEKQVPPPPSIILKNERWAFR